MHVNREISSSTPIVNLFCLNTQVHGRTQLHVGASRRAAGQQGLRDRDEKK